MHTVDGHRFAYLVQSGVAALPFSSLPSPLLRRRDLGTFSEMDGRKEMAILGTPHMEHSFALSHICLRL